MGPLLVLVERKKWQESKQNNIHDTLHMQISTRKNEFNI
jgi:hypothetical protein